MGHCHTQCYTIGAADSVMTSGKPLQPHHLPSRSCPGCVWWRGRGPHGVARMTLAGQLAWQRGCNCLGMSANTSPNALCRPPMHLAGTLN